MPISVNHSENIVEVKNVSFAYGKVPILTNVNLNIHRGDYLGVVGPNGGGKTTLIKLILGLLKPGTGSITMFGENQAEFRDWTKIGYVAQKVTHIDEVFPVTVKEIAAMGRYGHAGLLHNLTPKDNQVINWALEQVDLVSIKDQLIGNLSGGQQQRTFIARALAQQPEIIFLDEPTAGVDSEAQEQFYKLLKKLNQELEITLVLISHDVDVLTEEATEVVCINRGVVFYGLANEFIKEEQSNKLYTKNIKFIKHHKT